MVAWSAPSCERHGSGEKQRKGRIMSPSNPISAGDQRKGPAFLLDLDGTLVDSVYQHVLAWREALESAGIELSVWRIHRRIGTSGGLFVSALLRETGQRLGREDIARMQQAHEDAYRRLVGRCGVGLLSGGYG